jgi:hypothetical protein
MWNFAGMCVNADQGRLQISLGAIDDQTQAEFLPVLPTNSGFTAAAERATMGSALFTPTQLSPALIRD